MRAAVFYATREGQSQRVAERVAAGLRRRGAQADVINVKTAHGRVAVSGYQTAFVVASVHAGHHEKEMIEFVRGVRDGLTSVGASFLSLTLSQAGAEDPNATPAQRAAARNDALRMIDVFSRETGWHPARALPVAGALTYSKYNFLKKLIMKRIAHKAGFDGDTARDYEFTNWQAIDEFVDESGRAA